VTIRIAIGELIKTLRRVPNTQTIQGNNCLVKYLTICDACNHAHNTPFLVSTFEIEEREITEETEDQEEENQDRGYQGDNDQDDDVLDELSGNLGRVSMNKRPKLDHYS
jgi:hypothetical protein